LQELRKITEVLRHDSLYSTQKSNRTPAEQKSNSVHLEGQYIVIV